MRIENHSVEEYTQQDNTLIIGVQKQIERCGRICYRSEGKITDDSYIKFVERMKSDKHYSVLEHGTVYLQVPVTSRDFEFLCHRYETNKYSRSDVFDVYGTDVLFVTTNYRVLVENGWSGDLKYICIPADEHVKRLSFKVHTSIGTSREFNRHRCLSVSEQSTRYVNFSKDKFGNEIGFIKPYWCVGEMDEAQCIWVKKMCNSEKSYMQLINLGLPAQAARSVLPLDTATEVIYTAFEDDWEKVLKLRSSKAGATGQHPDANIIGNMIYDLLHG